MLNPAAMKSARMPRPGGRRRNEPELTRVGHVSARTEGSPCAAWSMTSSGGRPSSGGSAISWSTRPWRKSPSQASPLATFSLLSTQEFHHLAPELPHGLRGHLKGRRAPRRVRPPPLPCRSPGPSGSPVPASGRSGTGHGRSRSVKEETAGHSRPSGFALPMHGALQRDAVIGRVTILDTLAANAFKVHVNRWAKFVTPADAQVTPAFGQQRHSRVRSQQRPTRHPQAIAHLRIQPSRMNGLVPGRQERHTGLPPKAPCPAGNHAPGRCQGERKNPSPWLPAAPGPSRRLAPVLVLVIPLRSPTRARPRTSALTPDPGFE